MIEVNVQQGSADWHKLRAGIPTASGAVRILTPVKLQPSEQQDSYISELIAERVMGQPVSEFGGSYWTERGLEMEAEVARWYEFETGLTPRPIGLCYRDESRSVACSPDWLIDPDGGAEVKCPAPHTHVGYLRAGAVPAAYIPQIQWTLWVTGRAWWEFVSYHPAFRPLHIRVEPDPKWQIALDEAVPEFIERLEAEYQRVAGSA